MQRISLLLMMVGVLSLTVSCQNPIRQAGDEADRVVEKVDRTLERTEERVDRTMATSEWRIQRLLAQAKADIAETTEGMRETYSDALQETSAETSEKIDEVNEKLLALEARIEERITQVEIAALRVIQEGDAAAEARIDQVFTELRVFVKETLAQVRELITPVLELTANISEAVDKGQEHFVVVTEKILDLIEKVNAILTEVQETIREFRGKDPKTGEDTGEEGLFGLIAGLLGALLAAWTQWQRKRDQGRDGNRWKPEALTDKTRADVIAMIKSGEFDDELRGRLVVLGMISTKPNGGEK